MSEDKKTGSNSWQRTDGYKPEWAKEFDTDTPNQRSDSELFDRAVEMGVEAAEGLECEKLRTSSSSTKSKKLQTKKKQNGKPQTKGKHKKENQTKKSQNKDDTLSNVGAVLYGLGSCAIIAFFAFLGYQLDGLTGDNPFLFHPAQ